MFPILSETNFSFWVAFILLSEKALNLDQSKFFLFSKGLVQNNEKFQGN